MKLHLGCGGTRLEGFVNVDAERTDATDIVRNCCNLDIFQHGEASLIYSHAFFEHLFKDQRLAFLMDCRRILSDDGHIFFCGIPDFETVAKCYLKNAVGHVSPRFDLFEVYRYTHGYPEAAGDGDSPEWLHQLHKSLFDVNELKILIKEAGFTARVIFRYYYKNEANPVNLGFIAAKNNLPIHNETCRSILDQVGFNHRIISCE